MIHSQFNLNISAKDVYNDKGGARLLTSRLARTLAHQLTVCCGWSFRHSRAPFYLVRSNAIRQNQPLRAANLTSMFWSDGVSTNR